MTDVDLDAIEQRAKSAHPFIGVNGGSKLCIAEALADVPALVAEVRRLRAAMADAETEAMERAELDDGT